MARKVIKLLLKNREELPVEGTKFCVNDVRIDGLNLKWGRGYLGILQAGWGHKLSSKYRFPAMTDFGNDG